MEAPVIAIASGRDEDAVKGRSEQQTHHSGHAQKELGILMAGLTEGPRARAREGAANGEYSPRG